MAIGNRRDAAAAIRAATGSLESVAQWLSKDRPEPPIEPPDAATELFGIDISEHNGDIDLKAAERQGASFCFVRITGGVGEARTRHVWVDKNIGRNLNAIKDTNMVVGVYGYPVKPVRANIETQVDVFIRNAGGVEGLRGKLIGVDYERYGPDPDLTPTPQNVRDYCHELQRRIGPRHIFLYAGKSFWEEPPHSGNPRSYGAPGSIHLWSPWWPGDGTVSSFKEYYLINKGTDDVEWFLPIEGLTPKMAQVYIGQVAGRECDVNVFRGTREQLVALTGEVKPGDANGEDPDEPNAEGLPKWITRPRDYLAQCPGGPYIAWTRGRFNNGPPAWVIERGQALPPPERVRQLGGFCAAAHNLAHAANGIHPPDDVDSRPAWYGGVLWLGEIYQRERSVDRRPLENAADYPPMSLFVHNYGCGPFDATCPLTAHGHTFVKLRPGVAFNFDRQFGGNIRRDVPESIALSGGIDFWVHANDWLRPAGAATI